MSTPVVLNLNRGSNLAWPCRLVGVNITGWTFAVISTQPATLADNVVTTITDAANGMFTLSLPWSGEWPQGEGNKVSIRLKPSGLSEAFPEIQVNLQ